MFIKINSLYDFLSLLALFSYFYLFFSMDIVLVFGGFLCVFIHLIIKEITSGWYPPIFKRPDGARDCGLFNTGGLVDHKSGFPSGHVTAISFLMNSILLNKNYTLYNIFLYNVPVLLVAYARVMSGCHNTIQVVAGYILGITIANILQQYKSYIYKYFDKIKNYANQIKSYYILD